MSQENWKDLPYHAIIGIVVTAVYYVICMVLGELISGATLFIPLLLLAMFVLASWLLQQHIKKNNCCMTCNVPSPTNKTPSSSSDIISTISQLFPTNKTPASSPATKKCNPPTVRV